MTTWTLVLSRSPLNTLSGTGQLTTLTSANGISMTYNLYDADTVSWSMPGNHWQASMIKPLITDVLAYRDDDCVQRFRVTSSQISHSGGQVSASFAGVSYRGMLNSWMFMDTDTRSIATGTEQSLIAWNIINASQLRTRGNWNLSRGLVPLAAVNRTFPVTTENGQKKEYFDAGEPKGDAIKRISEVVDGFEYDIEPHVTQPQTHLQFNSWNAGQRRRFTPTAPLSLGMGDSVASYTRSVEPTDYWNVVRVTGELPTPENTNTTATDVRVLYRPVGKNPTTSPGSTVDEGRWEKSISLNTVTEAELTRSADAELSRGLNYLPQWHVDLIPGIWTGRTMAWKGDYMKLRIREDVYDEYGKMIDSPIINTVQADGNSETMRATTWNIGYAEGIETVGIDLADPTNTGPVPTPPNYAVWRSDLERRLSTLERR